MTTRYVGVSLISGWVRTNELSVNFSLVLLSPLASLPNSVPNAVVHTSLVSGSLVVFEYFLMISSVVGCITGAH